MRARRVVWSAGIATPPRLPRAPRGPLEAERAVIGVLGRTRATCLVRSLVLQRWLVDHGHPVDVVIGVTSPTDGFEAHAWLDRDDDPGSARFAELHRLHAHEIGSGPRRRAGRKSIDAAW